MKKIFQKQIIVLAAIVLLTGIRTYAAASSELFQQALYAEEIEGDLPSAINRYDQIIADPLSPQDHVVQALYRKGMCHVHLGEDQKAAAALNQLVSRFPDRTALVQKAQEMLDKLQYFDPASLMPADTMVYLELGSPGRQIETALEMLDVSPTSNPLEQMMRSTGAAMPAGPAVALSRFFNPSMLAEMKKVRSLAVGCPQFDPQGDSSFTCIMHPGESDALRGMIIAGLSVAGQPSGSIEGMTALQIPDGPCMAYDDKVIFIAYPKERLVACINQYKGVATEPSLAFGNRTFGKVDKMARQHNAATIWIDVDTLYNHVLQQHPDLPPNFQMMAGMLGLAGINDLLITHAIEPDGIGLNAMLNLKEGVPNMGYELLKTPPLKASGFEGVPPEAFYLVGIAHSTNNPAQLQQLQQMIQIGHNGPLPSEFINNIEQLALFALPGEAAIPEGMPFRPGLVLTCRDTAPVAQLLRERSAESQGMPVLQIAETNRTVVIALEPEIIKASLDALGGGASVLKEGILSDTLNQQIGTSQKVVLINAAGLVQLAGIQSAFHSGADAEMAENLKDAFAQLGRPLESTTLSIWTDEQPETLMVQARMNGIPSLTALVEPLGKLQEIVSALEQQQAAASAQEWGERLEELLKQPPARIVQTVKAPAVDGKIAAPWEGAVKYDLTKTIYDNGGGEHAIAGNYRMLWDAERLYVLIEVVDSTPVHNPDQAWQFNDGIELYLDATDAKPAGYGDTQYQFALLWRKIAAEALCVQSQGRSIHDIKTAMKNTSNGYCFEVSFPWSELGTTPEVGAHIGVEVQVNDNRGRGGRDAKISWHDPHDQAWLNPQYFGRAELVAGK